MHLWTIPLNTDGRNFAFEQETRHLQLRWPTPTKRRRRTQKGKLDSDAANEPAENASNPGDPGQGVLPPFRKRETGHKPPGYVVDEADCAITVAVVLNNFTMEG